MTHLLLLVPQAEIAKLIEHGQRVLVDLIKHDDLVVLIVIHEVLDSTGGLLLDVLDLHEHVVLRRLAVESEIAAGLEQLPKQALLRVFAPQAQVLQDILNCLLLLGLSSVLHSLSLIAHVLYELLSFHL